MKSKTQQLTPCHPEGGLSNTEDERIEIGRVKEASKHTPPPTSSARHAKGFAFTTETNKSERKRSTRVGGGREAANWSPSKRMDSCLQANDREELNGYEIMTHKYAADWKPASHPKDLHTLKGNRYKEIFQASPKQERPGPPSSCLTTSTSKGGAEKGPRRSIHNTEGSNTPESHKLCTYTHTQCGSTQTEAETLEDFPGRHRQPHS